MPRQSAAAALAALLLLAAAVGSTATSDVSFDGALDDGNSTECIENPYHPFESEFPGTCKTCDSDNSTCLECFDGYGLVEGKCERCEEYNCGACEGDIDVCTDCTFYWDEAPDTGFYAAGNGTCVECPTTYCRLCHNSNGTCFECNTQYGVMGDGTCEQCDDQDACLRCDGDTAQCDECYDGFVLLAGKCVACPKDCAKCSDPETCTQCDGSSSDDFDRGVVLDPPTSQCVPCAVGCAACPRGPGTCDSCYSSAWTNTTDGSCVTCTDPHCTTCAPYKPDQCKICASFNDAGDLQWGADKATGKCIDCLAGPNCASCQMDASVCDWCNDGHITDVVDAGTECRPCSSITPHCSGCTWDATVQPAKQSCDACEQGWELDEATRTCKQG
ncbi:serine threonine [Micractinium conductrix]|uniref:Serine threonine n=1 Tax=Micractinium conductrix TaxID=554055 RepID=A0A2P6V4R8_9CHLO|nr:serine threonine [Micractinium conductrix]|eukprot:PSC69074.1 serine threonine [Micractinium conductrix]